jgi:hypothetical protein
VLTTADRFVGTSASARIGTMDASAYAVARRVVV